MTRDEVATSVILCAQCQMAADVDLLDPEPGGVCQRCNSVYDPKSPRRDHDGWRAVTGFEAMKRSIDDDRL